MQGRQILERRPDNAFQEQREILLAEDIDDSTESPRCQKFITSVINKGSATVVKIINGTKAVLDHPANTHAGSRPARMSPRLRDHAEPENSTCVETAENSRPEREIKVLQR